MLHGKSNLEGERRRVHDLPFNGPTLSIGGGRTCDKMSQRTAVLKRCVILTQAGSPMRSYTDRMQRCRPLLIALILVVASLEGSRAVQAGQTTRPASPSAEQQVYDRYRDWTSSVPVEQRGAGLLARYRQHLQQQGVAEAEIDRQLAIIEREGRRLEADRW